MSGKALKKTIPLTDEPPDWMDQDEDENAPFIRSVEQSPRRHLNTFMMAVLAVVLLAGLGFVVLDLPNPADWVDELMGGNQVEASQMRYTFQLPFALFVGALLGPVPGLFAVGLFIILGLLAWPVFAQGGGLDYMLRPGFGYFLGMAAAAWVSGDTISYVLCQERNNLQPARRSIKLMGVGISGVLIAHLIGIFYMLGLMLLGYQTLAETNHWTLYLTLSPLLYDLTSAMIFMCFVRSTRLVLWPALY
jgi:biotin transport system substrate-specific component